MYSLLGNLSCEVWIVKRKKRSAKHKAWEAFSKFIRQRDADENGITACISCGKSDHWKNMDAGHYIAKSLSLALRFNEVNVQNQCVACNRWRHGNLTQYALALKTKYGEDILEQLDKIRREGEGTKISESDYRDLIERYEKQ